MWRKTFKYWFRFSLVLSILTWIKNIMDNSEDEINLDLSDL